MSMSIPGNREASASRTNARETTLVGYAPAPVPILQSVPLRTPGADAPSDSQATADTTTIASALEETAATSPAPSRPERRNPLSRRQAINRGRHLSRRFFEEGERHQRTDWEDAALASDEEDSKTDKSVHFDSFDEVPSRRLTGIALTGIAGAAVLGLAAWGMGWLRAPVLPPAPQSSAPQETIPASVTTALAAERVSTSAEAVESAAATTKEGSAAAQIATPTKKAEPLATATKAAILARAAASEPAAVSGTALRPAATRPVASPPTAPLPHAAVRSPVAVPRTTASSAASSAHAAVIPPRVNKASGPPHAIVGNRRPPISSHHVSPSVQHPRTSPATAQAKHPSAARHLVPMRPADSEAEEISATDDAVMPESPSPPSAEEPIAPNP